MGSQGDQDDVTTLLDEHDEEMSSRYELIYSVVLMVKHKHSGSSAAADQMYRINIRHRDEFKNPR